MKKTIDVFTGEVRSAAGCCDLVSHAIGSCIVVTAFYPTNISGSMAHIMLPGKAPEKQKKDKFKYAEDAINELLLQLAVPKNEYANINICLIGAGNVLKRQSDEICKSNIISVLDIIKKKNLKIKASALGGTRRRSVRFEIDSGNVFFTENGSPEMLLWKFV